MGPFDHLPKLDFKVIRERIDTLIAATQNKLEREWPVRLAQYENAAIVLRGMVAVSGNTYHTILFLVADRPIVTGRRPEYVASVPPLTRTILDALFNVAFLLDDLPARIEWYHSSGWRELIEENQRIERRYGDIPSWAAWISERHRFVEHIKRSWRVTEEQVARPHAIPYWPHPGQMLKHKALSPGVRSFLGFLQDWFYRDLSSASHLSWPGFAMRAQYLLGGSGQDSHNDAVLEKHRSDYIFRTLSILLGLTSEIEGHFRFGLAERHRFLWALLGEYSGEAKELYELRYQSLLA